MNLHVEYTIHLFNIHVKIMKKLNFIFMLVLIVMVHACNTKKQKVNTSSFPDLNSSFFAQKPPGSIPEVFAPLVVSKTSSDPAVAFSPDVKEIYFRRLDEGLKDSALVAIQYKDNLWTETFVVPRGDISPDGTTLYKGNEYREHTPYGWSEIKPLGNPFDSIPIMRLTASSKGTYYFDTSLFYDKSPRVGTISYSRLINGMREKPETLDIDMGILEAFHPFIAPDESYLIFDSRTEAGNLDMYISFRQKDSLWGPAINLGAQLNTELSEGSGSITSDGEYFFFTRFLSNGDKNTMWVDAEFIEKLRPKP